MNKRTISLICGALVFAAPRLKAQERGAAALGELVQSLGTTTRVLMIGAHPDDEDTQLIAYLAKGKHIQTAYLALTRGDGGQNLIGNELGDQLGMIRTEELLAARRIDGGRQYFSRAFDFGFSKTLDETRQHWPKDSVLKDVVAIVRAFRPHVIIAVFSGTPADGHGHHQYSGVIARDVFDAAADSVRYPAAKLGGLQPWTASTFYRLVRGGNGSLRFNVGTYDPLLGRTYSEIATISRSQHESQGQGGIPQKGPRFSSVRPEVSRVFDVTKPQQGLFDGIDTSWARFKSVSLPAPARSALDSLAHVEAAVKSSLDLMNPARSSSALAAYVRLTSRALDAISCVPLQALERDQRTCTPALGDLLLALTESRKRASEALLDAAGVSIDAYAPREQIAELDSMPVTLAIYNQGVGGVDLQHASLIAPNDGSLEETNSGTPDNARGKYIASGATMIDTLKYHSSASPDVPWWLRRPRWHDMFSLIPAHPGPFVSQEMITGEDRLQNSGVDVTLRIAGVDVPVRTGPVVYRYLDPARGEIRRPIAVVPALSLLMDHEVEYARANTPFDRTTTVALHSAATAPRDVEVSLSLPKGLKADSVIRHVHLDAFGDANVVFRLSGRLAPGRQRIDATGKMQNIAYDMGFVPISYEHIRPLRYYKPSTVEIEAVNATFANLRIGYIRGVGDNVMPTLEELGIPVTEIDPNKLAQTKLSGFTTIVIGPRAYEAHKSLVANNAVIMQFAKNGGTVVTQYGQFPYQQPGILPYPITLARPADRVTDENAQVRVLDPRSPLLSTPNKIVDADFANWVQERSSYMPRTFDKAYHTVFSMNDKDEPPNDAAVLVAPLGKGTYVYTTFVFFRELPAGNPGAARLFINLLSANQRATARPSAASTTVHP
ncbi:MAG TPA: PIG-L family deacetylase [Gemmatimonadaceae bacterium]